MESPAGSRATLRRRKREIRKGTREILRRVKRGEAAPRVRPRPKRRETRRGREEGIPGILRMRRRTPARVRPRTVRPGKPRPRLVHLPRKTPEGNSRAGYRARLGVPGFLS